MKIIKFLFLGFLCVSNPKGNWHCFHKWYMEHGKFNPDGIDVDYSSHRWTGSSYLVCCFCGKKKS